MATAAWDHLGYVRAEDYARERLGTSGRQLRELARVDGALADLPRAERAFLAGELSWSKLRLVARVAEHDDETHWLDLASRLTATSLAREIREVDARVRGPASPFDPARPDGTREGLRLQCNAGVRAKWYFARQVAQRVAGRRLDHADFAEILVAEALSARPEAAVGCEPEVGSRANGSAGPRIARRRLPCAAPRDGSGYLAPDAGELRDVARLVEGLDRADAFDLDRRLRSALRLERRRDARRAPALLAIRRGREFLDLGFRSFDAYVRERLGMAPSQARQLVRIQAAAERSAQLCTAWSSGAIGAEAARTLLPVLELAGSRPWHEAWLRRARQVTVRRLEHDVERALLADEADPAKLPLLDGGLDCELPVGHRIGAEPRGSGEHPARGELRFAVPGDVAQLMHALLALVQRRIERCERRVSSESEALGAILDHALHEWGPREWGSNWDPEHAPERKTHRSRRIFERDGWRCAVPGCTSYRELHAHHIRFRSAGGGDEEANQVTLCAAHHHRGVHVGRVRVRGRAPDGLRFELGLREHRPPLEVFGSGEVRMS